MRPSGTNIFQHFHASFFFIWLGHTLQFRICKWVSEWASEWAYEWVYEWVYECMNGKSANLHNNSNRKLCICRVASGYEVTKSPSCSRCTFHRQRRGKDGKEMERRGGVEERYCTASAILFQLAFAWGKWKTGSGLQTRDFSLPKTKTGENCETTKKIAVDTL